MSPASQRHCPGIGDVVIQFFRYSLPCRTLYLVTPVQDNFLNDINQLGFIFIFISNLSMHVLLHVRFYLKPLYSYHLDHITYVCLHKNKYATNLVSQKIPMYLITARHHSCTRLLHIDVICNHLLKNAVYQVVTNVLIETLHCRTSIDFDFKSCYFLFTMFLTIYPDTFLGYPKKLMGVKITIFF